MNFLNLKYFIVTAEEMNFTKAAKRLFISQQSLSNHIAKLEDYFGVQLFDRNTPLTLTDAGESLLKSARKILNVKQGGQYHRTSRIGNADCKHRTAEITYILQFQFRLLLDI